MQIKAHKTIFITGAGSGIGRATAKRFAKAGWFIGAGDVDVDALQSLKQELGEGRCAVFELDVTSAKQCREVLSAYTDLTGGYLRVLLNNAGILSIGSFEKISPGTHGRIVDINVKGVINMAHAAFRHLRMTPAAQMISLSSASAVYGTPDFASYSASKFAVRALTEALSIEWKKYDIQVKDVMPPFVKTNMLAKQTVNPKVLQRLGINLAPEDVANTIYHSIRSKRMHTPVGRSFNALWRVAQITPTEGLKKLMLSISGH